MTSEPCIFQKIIVNMVLSYYATTLRGSYHPILDPQAKSSLFDYVKPQIPITVVDLRALYGSSGGVQRILEANYKVLASNEPTE